MSNGTFRRKGTSSRRLYCVLGCAVGLALALALATRAPGAESPGDIPVADAGLFDRLDTNGDGQIDAAEVPTDERSLLERLVRQGDANGDGQLDRNEWKKATTPRRPAKPLEEKESGEFRGADAARLILLTLDTNRDSQLTRDEAPEEHIRWFNQLAERFDADKNGTIDRRELARTGPQLARVAERLVRDTPRQIERQLKRFEREQGELAKRFDQPPQRARPMRGQGRGGGAMALFRRLDTNGDGVVEVDDSPGAGRWIREGDRNGDEQLSAAEFRRAFRQRRQEASQTQRPRPAIDTPAKPKGGDEK